MKIFKAYARDRNGQWYYLAEISAPSMKQARDKVHIRTNTKLRGKPESHYPTKGCAVYEYDNGAIAIELL